MDEILLKLNERTATGKKASALRKENIIPSVVYSDGKSILTQSEEVATLKAVKTAGRHTPVELNIDGKKHLAIIKEIDVDPVKHSVRHVAFHLIKRNEIITTEVAISLTSMGESEAEKAGLVILQAIDKIDVKAKPADLPETLNVSVAKLATVDDKLTLADIKLPAGVEFADGDIDKELVLANVYEPSALQAANESAGGTAEEAAPVEESATDESASEAEKEEKKA